MTRPVLVTGGAGVLGKALASTLAGRGDQVVSMDIRPWPAAPPGVRHTVGDIRDRERMRLLTDGAGAVVHCASALPSYPAATIRSVIVDGSRSVLDAARHAGVSRVVYISTTSVYGLPTVVPTPETYPRQPVDPYGVCKVEVEQMCERLRDEGMVVPILRPKTFLGPGRMGLFAMLFEWAEEGHNFPLLGGGRALTQMCATEDVVTAVLAVLEAPDEIANDTYNVAAAEFGSLRDDFQAVLDAAGHGKRVVGVPARSAAAVLNVLSMLRLSPIYRRLAYKLIADSYVSIEHAGNRLGFQPRYSNREAILAAYEWWRANRGSAAGRAETRQGQATGRTSDDPWRQRALTLAKAIF
ncbi:NAD(P)-dependent oxidoreductase [Plantactinospora sp. KBS50]|uniref:NAD-dependent epimerase/dehydratase family protein n=1 Tax=Plantactinospora sp. KBS50 TaxID=2024580 RepID=UPI000BAAB349|nr:NAD-dependent epimerase/dehydratase family protein [Plantactinospora sp. KBS50]ASW57172.1 epimerase [Plantactinospora sp. KBS50]